MHHGPLAIHRESVSGVTEATNPEYRRTACGLAVSGIWTPSCAAEPPRSCEANAAGPQTRSGRQAPAAAQWPGLSDEELAICGTR
jgi:hypothetical protein